MAVYKRTYRPYTGAVTPEWSRFLVVSREAARTLLASRVVILLLIPCFFLPLIASLIIYLRHNSMVLTLLRSTPAAFNIDERFFLGFLSMQSWTAFLLIAFIGPTLISRDVINNAMPLYLSRPFSRAEYVGGKLLVLLALQSLVTWIPGLLLFVLHGELEGGTWMSEHLWLAGAIVAGSLLWSLLLSLLALAISAWVKWRAVATGLMFGVFIVAAAFGEAVNEILDTHFGHLLNIGRLMGSIWADLFRTGVRRTMFGDLFGIRLADVPIWEAWTAIGAVCLICLAMLARKVRACEVVRG